MTAARALALAQGDALPDLSDVELVTEAARGDTAAFSELVRRHQSAVYRTARIASGSDTDADDVAQDTFVSAFRRLEQFRGQAQFRTWLLSIAWRKALDRRRILKRWVQGFSDRDEEAGGQEPEAAPAFTLVGGSPEQLVLDAELRGHVRRLVNTLPAKVRDPLLLVSSGDHTYEEAAALLNCPVGTIKWRVSEARRQLKAKLARVGFDNV